MPGWSGAGEEGWFEYLQGQYPEHDARHVALVSVSGQLLSLFESGQLVAQYAVSTARNGIGGQIGSEKTPPGVHFVREKIGEGAPSGTVFSARRDTGRVVTPELLPVSTGNDYVTTRILWLSGLEEGVNQGPGVDSYRRYIYIHGTQEEGLIGQPASHGCVRMRNDDVIELFEKMPLGSLVVVTP
ncbi:MAG: L,D-transpeptidase family protein [bacterium]